MDVQGGPLKEYDVVVNGVTLRMRLSEADARKRGVWQDPEPAVVKSKAAAKPRARRSKNKMVDVEDSATGGE